MIRNKMFWILPILVAATWGTGQCVYGEMVAGVSLNAQSVVSSFNGMNGGRGLNYAAQSNWADGQWHNYMNNGGSFANTSAYAPSLGGSSNFISVCVEPLVGLIGPGYATLSYSGGQSASATDGNILSVGAAYLYMLYATGRAVVPTMAAYAEAIKTLMGAYYDGPIPDGHWNSNAYLSQLLSVNSDKNYWQSAYNPDAYYTEIGNYSVFVASAGTGTQSFLYLSNAARPYDPPVPPPPGDVPEPASLLLWVLGVVGLAGSRMRPSRMKKLAGD